MKSFRARTTWIRSLSKLFMRITFDDSRGRRRGRIKGIVNVDDMSSRSKEATEDIQKSAASSPWTGLLTGSLAQDDSQRAGWLAALFLGEMLNRDGHGIFRSRNRQSGDLALFVPLIISSGGNSGSQQHRW